MSDYTPFSKTFAQSRKDMHWPEIDYFLSHPIFQQPNLKILDVGCGSGRFLSFLQKQWLLFSYIGTDASLGMIEEAKKEHPGADFRVMAMQDLHFDEKFDRMVFLASFHHLETEKERLETLKKTKNILAEEWVIAMTNWNLMGPLLLPRYEQVRRPGTSDFDVKIGTYSRFYHGFELAELEELFQETGFEVLEHRVFENEKNILSIIRKKTDG